MTFYAPMLCIPSDCCIYTPNRIAPYTLGLQLIRIWMDFRVLLPVTPVYYTMLKRMGALELQKDGSLKTDEHFAVSGLSDVYAIGDIATYPYHGPGGNGSPVRIEHWNVAQNAGRAVGRAIIHARHSPLSSLPRKPFIPIFWSALGAQLRYCGNTVGGYDDMVLKGEPENGKFVAYYTSGDVVVAVATMGMDPVMAKSADLMRRGKMPGKKDIVGGLDVLQIK